MSAFKQKFLQKQIQTLSLSYDMKMSLELLQMNALQLSEYIEKELLDNPLFEVDIPARNSFGNQEEFDIADQKKSLVDDIMIQVKQNKLNLVMVEGILRQCDGNGYLLITLEELAIQLNISRKELETYLHCLHQCIPYGIASQNLSECLAIQIKQCYPQETLALALVEHHLEDIAKHYLDKLAKKYQVSQSEIKRCIALIQTLNPRPASSYDVEHIIFVKPDIILEREEDEVHIITPAYFNVKENEFYKKQSFDQADQVFMKEKRMQGRAIIECLKSRKETLHKIMQVMVSTQKVYLLHQGDLQYLIMKDIGETIGMHETTISRAMKDKYYEMEGQVYPMHKLLCKQLHETSVDRIVTMIKTLIEHEDCTCPLSDQNIVERLKEKNILCSRRTINKYRMEQRIPSAQTRKRRKDQTHG